MKRKKGKHHLFETLGIKKKQGGKEMGCRLEHSIVPRCGAEP